MKTIDIYSKKYGSFKTIVDDEDHYFLITNFKWYIAKDHTKEYYYPVGNIIGNSKIKYRLSRLVMNANDPDVFVDHIDRNPLNNKKSNLRFATQSQNQHNRPRLKSKSGFKGVRKTHGGPGYQIVLQLNKRTICGGTSPSIIEAAYNYNAFARKHHGEFAYQNPVTAIKYADGIMYTHEVKTPCSTPIRDKDFIIEQVRTFIPNRL